MTIGISRGGADAESRFLELTGAVRSARAGDGDAILEGNLVEIKAASSSTLNQVRATKYIVLVAFATHTGEWYVVPPHEVVRLVSSKRRGQHTENPFESATLSLTHLTQFKLADESQLRPAVLAAAEAGARHPEVLDAMQFVLGEAQRLSSDSRERVRRALQRG